MQVLNFVSNSTTKETKNENIRLIENRNHLNIFTVLKYKNLEFNKLVYLSIHSNIWNKLCTVSALGKLSMKVEFYNLHYKTCYFTLFLTGCTWVSVLYVHISAGAHGVQRHQESWSWSYIAVTHMMRVLGRGQLRSSLQMVQVLNY